MVLIVTVLGFTLAATSVSHLNVTSRLSQGHRAHLLAESAVALAIEQFSRDETFGSDPTANQQVLHPLSGGASGELVFGSTGYYSTNNLTNDAPVQGWNGRVVPAHGAHLIGVGRSGGVEKRVEVVLVQPPFPFVLGSSGPVRSSGGLLVAGLPDAGQLVTGLNPADLKPGDLVSNANGPGAIELGPDTTVTGRLETTAASQDVIYDRNDPTIQIRELEFQAAPEELPVIDLALYDPRSNGQTVHRTLTDPRYRSETLKGSIVAEPPSGTVEFSDSLTLDGALLFVDGDLRIQGGLQGIGAVVATGNVEVLDGTALRSDNNTALLAGGDIALWGNGTEASYFQGLIYTEGHFLAEQVTLVGTLIARSDQGDKTTTLNNTRLIATPGQSQLSFTLTPPSSPGPTGPSSFNVDAHRTGQTGPGLPGIVISSSGAGRYDMQLEINGSNSGIGLAGGTLDEAVAFVLAQLSGFQVEEAELRTYLDGLQTNTPQIITPLLNPPGGNGQGTNPNPTSPDPAAVVVTIDPSEFLRFETRVRIGLWQPLSKN